MSAENIKARIDTFASEHDGSMWGPAHVVIADYNLSDLDLHGAISDLEARIAELENGGYSILDIEADYDILLKVSMEPQLSVEMHHATLDLMRQLLTTPETERVQVAWINVKNKVRGA